MAEEPSRSSRRRRSRRRTDTLWRRSSWFGVAAVCLLLAGVIGLRLLSHLDNDPVAEFLPGQNGTRIDTSTDSRLRKAFNDRDLGRLLLACRSAWDVQFNRVLQPQGLAWRPEQLDFHVAEGADSWRHYWCRQGAVGRGGDRQRPDSVGGRQPLPLDLLLHAHAEVLAEPKLRALEVLGDGNGGVDLRLLWNDGLRSGPQRQLPAGSFDSLFVEPSAARAATALPDEDSPQAQP